VEGRTEHGLDFAGSGHFVFCVCVSMFYVCGLSIYVDSYFFLDEC
jgi:hypothetical protein